MHEYEVLKTTTTVKRHIQAAIRTNYYFSRITIHLFTYSTNFQKLRRKLHVYQKERHHVYTQQNYRTFKEIMF